LARGVTDQDFLGVVAWVVKRIELLEFSQRWWELDNLLRVPALARDFTYGGTYHLDQWSQDLSVDARVLDLQDDNTLRQTELRQLETVLSRSREDNALIVGEAGPDKLDLVFHFVQALKNNTVIGPLQGRRVILFNVAMFIAGFKTQAELEQALLQVLNEASAAGNIILVIDDFPTLLAAGTVLGVNLIPLLDPYLTAPELQIVALADLDRFHQDLEKQVGLLSRFEKITVAPLVASDLAELLLRSVWQVESRYGLFFTYKAVLEIAKSADYYFPDNAGSDKSLDLLLEIAPWARQNNFSTIDQDQVLAFIQAKTNIPVGALSSADKDQLLKLEETLAGRVVGQTEAIKAVASAMRRARSGVRNPNRPIGSFLFLGPTGVGKTETSKALAAAFFGQEAEMRRLDMSEYQGPGAVDHLIGSYANGSTGLLADMLREHPYGVLLLDEFEKTNPEVLNLFLPILDEGVFADASGRKVSAKNTIFIATSNAGADLIWDKVTAGQNPSANELIDEIVKRAIFKPELLNRFDAVIVYKPLGDAELLKIARLMLLKLAQRLEVKGVVLNITDDLVAKVAKNGANKVFGARPMQRYIQDQIEQLVADALIAGSVGRGMKISFVAKPEAIDTPLGLALSVEAM
jgi:ATP-dependent Clp protease ATP-binding subunit ClpC